MAALELPVLRGERVTLRPAVAADAEDLAAILAEPAVARWWGSWDVARVRRDLLEYEGDAGLAIEAGGELAGYLQVSEEEEPDYRHAEIDLFLDPRVRGRGLGPDTVRALADHLVAKRGHHRIVIGASVDNRAAVRAYEKAGFRPVGVTERSWRDPEGRWRDELLMERVETVVDSGG